MSVPRWPADFNNIWSDFEDTQDYDTNEFIVLYNPETRVWAYGSDGGCSCYDGFDPTQLNYSDSYQDVLDAIAEWAPDGSADERLADFAQSSFDLM